MAFTNLSIGKGDTQPPLVLASSLLISFVARAWCRCKAFGASASPLYRRKSSTLPGPRSRTVDGRLRPPYAPSFGRAHHFRIWSLRLVRRLHASQSSLTQTSGGFIRLSVGPFSTSFCRGAVVDLPSTRIVRAGRLLLQLREPPISAMAQVHQATTPSSQPRVLCLCGPRSPAARSILVTFAPRSFIRRKGRGTLGYHRNV